MPSHRPKVVIVGRPNVGKSSLLNMLAGRRVSIVDPTAGVTRDRVATVVDWPAGGQKIPQIELIDTGGYGIQDPVSPELSSQIERQIALGLAEADLILVVIDAQTGVTPLDQKVVRVLRDMGRLGAAGGIASDRVLLIANKVDDAAFEAHAYEAASLGLGTPIPVSAESRFNRANLVDMLQERLSELSPRAPRPEPTGDALATPAGPLLAIVGKRNAGKSTLVNALAGGERVIVSEIEGTTRDSIDVHFEFDGKSFTAIDTAGVRKRKSLADDIEFYSYHRSLRAIRRAEVVLLLIDATVPLSQVDSQLSNEVLKHFKPTVVVINKWDLAQAQHTQEEYIDYLDEHLKGLNFAPVAFISAKENEGLRELVAMALNLYQQAGHRMPTGQLNRAVEAILAAKPPGAKGGRSPKVYYVTQLGIHPPSIGLFVNNPDLFDAGYQRYLMNRFRDELPFSEVPIKLLIRGKDRAPEGAAERDAEKQ